MRDYSKVSGQFWTGETGKKMRGNVQQQLVAMYLMTSPHANMIGVYNCPIIYIAHETGSTLEGATEGLNSLCEGGFCTYDEATDTVWVHEMARFQIGDELKPGDKRVLGIQKLYDAMPEGRIKAGFAEKYGHLFHLKLEAKAASPLQAPPKPEAGTEAGTEAELKPTADKPPKFDPMSMTLPEDLKAEDWREWVKYRKALKGKQPIQQTWEAQAKNLATWGRAGHDPTAIVKNSIDNGYQGLFEPKGQANGKNGSSRGGRIADTIRELTGANRSDSRVIEGQASYVD